MPGFNYVDNLTSVVNALKAYNTTTSSPDLSGSLTARLPNDNIMAGDPSVAMIRSDRLPAIFVRIASSQEEFAAIGATGPSGNSKFKTVVYDIFAMHGREGANARHQTAITSVAKMLQNIEAVFQAEYQLSGTAMWCHPRSTAISNVPLDAEGATWIKTAMVELEAKYFFR